MRQLILVIGVVAAVFVGVVARASSGGTGTGVLVAPRVCTGDDFDEEAGLCTTNARGTVLKTDDLVCSVNARVERPTRLTVAITYDGQLQRRASRTVRPAHGKTSLRLRFPNLRFREDPTREAWGLPAGRYACDFRLGSKRALVRLRTTGAAGTILVPHACRPLGGGTPIEYVCDQPGQGRAVACTAVFVHRSGHRLGVQIFRGQGDAAALLYEGSDVARVPIAAEWAYTSAPDAGFLTPGPYECRFLIDGHVAATTPFTIPG